ncbi:uncharacterized protein VTP21DRAFT_4753 [Calcarisporiella thermophila]|uniref:uncharacterized protein n=1 Tax=Calcarisporiella thermophila TaxID=911321 RepID=UPI00374245B0
MTPCVILRPTSSVHQPVKLMPPRQFKSSCFKLGVRLGHLRHSLFIPRFSNFIGRATSHPRITLTNTIPQLAQHHPGFYHLFHLNIRT